MARDIHELEVEFAKNPTPDACIPLCEAYLAQKRFMEAMVVCKKGQKNAPADVRMPLVLARIYLDQGKAPKAEQELATALKTFPNQPQLLEIQGRMFLELGRRDEGIRALQQALSVDPSLQQAQAMLRQLGVAPPQPQAPPQPAQPPPQQQARPQQQTAMPQQGAPPPRPGGPPQQAGGPPMRPGQGPQQQAGPPPMAQQGVPPGPPQQRQAAPQQMQQPMQAPAPQPLPHHDSHGSQPEKALEHVGDFFAPDTLGFSHDSAIETAGPGRLTILGFVPKTTGSIKTTIMVALAVLASASAWMGWQYFQSAKEKKLAAVIRDVRAAIDDDTYVRYLEAAKRDEDALAVDSSAPIALSTMAYTNAVLLVDHQMAEAEPKAREFLDRADKAGGDESAYRIAARALLAYYDKSYDTGIASVKKMQDRNINDPKIEVEAFRLLLASKPSDKDTQIQERRLSSIAAGSVRAQNFLGWYYYIRDNWERADAMFAGALQSNRNQPQALIGKSLVDLDRGIGLKERQVEVEGNLKRVFANPDDLSKPTLALAYFARSQLYQFQQKTAEADADFKKAQSLDPQNPIFDYRRGVTLLGLQKNAEALEALKRAASKAPNDPRYFKRLAEAQSATGDPAGAKASLDRAAQLAPNDFEVKLLEGQRLRAQKKFEDAIAVYKTIDVAMGAEAYARAQIGISQAYRESGRAGKATQQMEEFLQKVPSGTGKQLLAQGWCELGQAHQANNNRDAAMTSYQQGIDEFMYEPNCHYFYCKALGGGPEAKQQCELYMTLSPNGEYVADARRRSAGGGGAGGGGQ